MIRVHGDNSQVLLASNQLTYCPSPSNALVAMDSRRNFVSEVSSDLDSPSQKSFLEVLEPMNGIKDESKERGSFQEDELYLCRVSATMSPDNDNPDEEYDEENSQQKINVGRKKRWVYFVVLTICLGG